MHEDHQTRLSLASPGDLLAAVPYLLGFHPADSLVIVGLTGNRVTVAGRADLPQPADRSEWTGNAATRYRAMLRNVDATAAILIGYGPATTVTPVIDALTRHLHAAGITVHDALRVTDGRYHSYLCADPRCCPPDGVPFDPASSATAVHAVVAGQTALPDRAALVASIAPTAGAAVAAATARAQQRRLTVRAAAGRAALIRTGRTAVDDALARYAADAVLTDDEAAWLSVLLTEVAVRDIAGQATGTEPSHLALWTDLTRRVDPALAAAPASLLAFTAWRLGHGALASVALDRAFAADPHYRLAHLIDQALRHGVPPTALNDWPSTDSPTP